MLRQRGRMLWHFIVARFRHGERYGLDFTLAFLAILAAMWIFVVIVGAAVTEEQLNSIDAAVQEVVMQLPQESVTKWVVFITDLGGTRGTVIGVIVVGMPLLLRRRGWSVFGLVFATAGGGLIVLGLKEFFARARPIEQIVDVGGYAFPSGHAFSAMVFFGYLIYLGHKHLRVVILQVLVTIAAFTMIVLIGASRVYLNVHWFTDVLGGFFAGLVWLVLSILIVRHVEWPERSKLRREKEDLIEHRHELAASDEDEVPGGRPEAPADGSTAGSEVRRSAAKEQGTASADEATGEAKRRS